MTTTTTKGYELLDKLAPALGWTMAMAETCSLIARHATTYAHIQERWCNDEMDERTTSRLEARESRLEARIRDLVGQLPETDDGPITVHFDGDPRGWTVKLVLPGEWAKLHDDWGREGVGVPGS